MHLLEYLNATNGFLWWAVSPLPWLVLEAVWAFQRRRRRRQGR
jgi:hypothetical protein